MKLETMENLGASQPEIEAETFILRPPRPSDAGLITLYTGDERLAWNTATIPHPLPPGAAEAFIDRAQATDRAEDVWIIDGTRSHGSEVMGAVGLKRVDTGQCELGYWVAQPHWNTGIATAAIAALLEANPLGCRTIFASVFQDNPASARVLTKRGFRYLGDAETFSVARGARVPTWTYSLKLD
ncbi:GNAT family N-acetyltransferase [Roseovarius salis]|uniref:GNAT family N-acetyltransferase n=1 Tax=Roseovarius salis TaxID=3376063 RepID=UPI0037C7236B